LFTPKHRKAQFSHVDVGLLLEMMNMKFNLIRRCGYNITNALANKLAHQISVFINVIVRCYAENIF
jgi:hypothetical protein